MRGAWLVAFLLLLLPAHRAAAGATPGGGARGVVIITVDTLRADRLSAYGYERPTSPEIDRLLAGGARFTNARTVEPLTGPGLCSLWTSLHPHEHGATRNGLPMRPRLPSLAKLLRREGWETAAFVGNWTLRDRLTGLGEHFEHYAEILSRKRWLLFTHEATAEDLNEEALGWLDQHLSEDPRRPFLLWIHYVEPHAPYRLHEELAPRLGIPLAGDKPARGDRYDTEVAYVDQQIGLLLAGLRRHGLGNDTIVVFGSDHGESLGEHGYWGHGRNIFDPNLAIPLGISWPRRLPAGQRVTAPALLVDLAPTVLGLLGLPGGEEMRGHDWSGVLTGRASPPTERITGYQAHKGAVTGAGDADRARERGLLEVGIMRDGRKEVFRLRPGIRSLYDLGDDPRERRSLVPPDSPPSPELKAWLELVQGGLEAAGDLPVGPLDDESRERMRALGYVD